MAQGVVDAYKNMGNITVPIIVRLQGTNADIAKTIIDESGLEVHSAIPRTQGNPIEWSPPIITGKLPDEKT